MGITRLSKNISLIVLLSALSIPLVACGEGDGSSSGNHDKISDSSDTVVDIVKKVNPISALSTVSAPPPIYEAKKIELDELVQISAEGDHYYAIRLNENSLYSFDNGPLEIITDSISRDLKWEIYDANGKIIKITDTYSRFGWTPPSTDIYYIRPKQGKALIIRNHGKASSDPYVLNAEPIWLTESILFSLSESIPNPEYLVNLYANETYRFTVNNRAGAGDLTITTGGGSEIASIPIASGSIVKQTITVNNSDTYIIKLNGLSTNGSNTGNKILTEVEYLRDSDGDGDPDETDSYPNDPKRSSKGSTGGGSTGDVEACEKPYTGDSSDPQFYTFDAIAQFAQCAYRTTGNTDYVINGDQQCFVLNGLIQATSSKFIPQYCAGDKLIR